MSGARGVQFLVGGMVLPGSYVPAGHAPAVERVVSEWWVR